MAVSQATHVRTVLILVRAAVPVLGVAAFGWTAVGVVFALWFDSLAYVWGFTAGALEQERRHPRTAAAEALRRPAAWLRQFAVGAALLSAPVLICGIFLFALAVRGSPADALAQLFEEPHLGLVAVGIALARLGDVWTQARIPPSAANDDASLQEFKVVIARLVAILFAATGLGWLPPGGLWALGYTALIAGITAWSELAPARFLRVLAALSEAARPPAPGR